MEEHITRRTFSTLPLGPHLNATIVPAKWFKQKWRQQKKSEVCFRPNQPHPCMLGKYVVC